MISLGPARTDRFVTRALAGMALAAGTATLWGLALLYVLFGAWL